MNPIIALKVSSYFHNLKSFSDGDLWDMLKRTTLTVSMPIIIPDFSFLIKGPNHNPNQNSNGIWDSFGCFSTLSHITGFQLFHRSKKFIR